MRLTVVLLTLAAAAYITEATGRQAQAGAVRCPEANQAWEDCGSACPMSCALLRRSVPCPLNCVPGCYCQDPYILQSGKSGPCVLPEKCPKKSGGKRAKKPN